MKLSFVVPAYNEQAYLPDCLESILAQTQGMAESTEIIVVNNASTDATREVALRYPRVRVVDEMRKGLPFARQAGVSASTGELIAHVDADSRLTPGWVSSVLREFATRPKLAALSGPVVYYDLTSREKTAIQVFYGIAFVTYFVNRFVLRIGSMVQGGNFVTRRASLEDVGGFNLAITFYGEDTDIARRLSAVGEVRFTLALKMFSSARRLRKEGMLRMAWKYGLNYFWTTFLKRPFTLQHIDVREPQESI